MFEKIFIFALCFVLRVRSEASKKQYILWGIAQAKIFFADKNMAWLQQIKKTKKQNARLMFSRKKNIKKQEHTKEKKIKNTGHNKKYINYKQKVNIN